MTLKDAKEYIRDNISIVDYIGQYVDLKRTGSNFIGKCPFHNDKTPSFSVSDEKKMFKCFSASCNKTGDIFKFVEEYDHIDFVEAVKKLADKLNIKIDNNNTISKTDLEKQKLYDIYKIVANEYYKILLSDKGKQGREYLNDRHISFDTVKSFGIGYSTDEYNRIYSFLKSKGYDDDILTKSELFTYKENGKVYDKFFNRVMFPILNEHNKVIAFGGRVLNKEKVDTKYLNSKETLIFKKSHNLFALNKAKYSKYDYFILCEGNIDVITMHQHGFDNAIASLGTGFNEYQAKLIKKYKSKVIMSFDTDEAGTKFTLDAIPILEKEDIKVRILNLKPCKDPDEFLNKYNKDDLEKRILSAKDPILFRVGLLKNKYDINNPDEWIEYINEICKILTEIKQKLFRDKYIEYISKSENIDTDKLYIAFENFINNNHNIIKNIFNNKNKTTNIDNKYNIEKKEINKNESYLLNILLNHTDITNKINNILSIDEFSDEYCKKIYKYILDGLDSVKIYDEIKNDENFNTYMDIIFNDKRIEDNNELIKTINELIKKIKINSINNKIKSAEENNNFDLFAKLNNELKNIKNETNFIND